LLNDNKYNSTKKANCQENSNKKLKNCLN